MSSSDVIVKTATILPIAYSINVIWQNQKELFNNYLIYLGLSFAAYFITDRLIPVFKAYNQKADLFGKDLNKKGTPAGDVPVPESLGNVPATLFLLFNMFGLLYIKNFIGGDYTHEHTAALLSICFVVFLGFSDDVLDLPWRYKIILPTIASIPILVSYSGTTDIVVPIILRQYLGHTINLGILYYFYMGNLAVFCTNAINIYAGINGLECGQSLIIAVSIFLHNIVEISLIDGPASAIHPQIFSVLIILPFIFTSLALFKYNKYPSQVFVGDTYCYFAGMTFSVVGILGHFSKTLLLFFIPQILNFLLSIPQLIGIIHCPRHRLPKFDLATGLLQGVPNHLTLINFFLRIKGPTSEKNTCSYLLIFQIICCAGAFFIRYVIPQYFF